MRRITDPVMLNVTYPVRGRTHQVFSRNLQALAGKGYSRPTLGIRKLVYHALLWEDIARQEQAVGCDVQPWRRLPSPVSHVRRTRTGRGDYVADDSVRHQNAQRCAYRRPH